MKKILFALLVVALTTPLLADDAKVLPQGVFRLSTAPVYSFASEGFEDDFRFADSAKSIDDIQVLSLGLALEYGVNDWITAAAQWTPGFTLWSDVDATGRKTANAPTGQAGTVADGDITVGRWFDVFIGAKFQLLGPNAPVPVDNARLAIAAGVKTPLPSSDWEDEEKNLNSDKDFVAANVDNNVLGLGMRFYYDMLITEKFFINLFTEVGVYPNGGDPDSLTTYGTIRSNNTIRQAALAGQLGALAQAGAATVEELPTDEYEYGYDITFEIEPQYETTIAPGVNFSAGLPLTVQYLPEPRLDGRRLSEVRGFRSDGAGGIEIGNLFPNAGPSTLWTVQPNVEFFFTTAPVPTAVNIGYRHAIAGQNSNATNAVVLVIKNYLAF